MKSTDKGIDRVKDAMEDAFGFSANALSKIRVISGSLAKGLYKGFTTVLKMFSK